MDKNEIVTRILGVDPGTNVLGYAVLDASVHKMKLVDLGVLQMKGLPNHQIKLKEIFLNLQEIIEHHMPTHLAIEAPFYSKNVQSMLKLGRAQGVAMAAAMTMGLKISEYSPKRVKQSVTGNGNASKEQVAAMLERLLAVNLKDSTFDSTDALAVAYCHFIEYSSPGKGRKKSQDWASFIRENERRLIR